MKTILTALAAIALTAGLLLSCALPVSATVGDSNDRDLGQPPVVPIRLTIMTDRPVYTPGTPILMTLLATNTADIPVTLSFPTAQRFDFVVSYKGTELWKWSADKVFPQVTGKIVLKPGQQIAFQTKEYKAQLPPIVINEALYTMDLTGIVTSSPSLTARTTFKVAPDVTLQ
jgi:hypothetical protein